MDCLKDKYSDSAEDRLCRQSLPQHSTIDKKRISVGVSTLSTEYCPNTGYI